ncbi:TetR/AcrR family transcriptional regulator [Streptomyces resistomycificus]|uniref:RemM protein n=1 Tax=Streptomyces resistomycificus TaxID=67356 RepID=Q70DW3_9ACTN|nr:TetR/AcrR family transcriptional regulator [Streptomyces resistomycificus]CAE51183.1 RemM protein [Streptomyces resistomycificus]
MVEQDIARSAPGRPRSAEVSRGINLAALALLRERGPQGVTVEAVAQYSGSAKTTIYRRYKNRYELLRSSLAFVEDIPEPSPGLPVRERLVYLLTQFRHGLEEVVGLRALVALLHGDEDPEFTQVFRETILGPRLEVIFQTLRSGVESGELRADADYETVVSMLAGSFIARFAVRGAPPPADWADAVVDTIWPAIRAA